MTREENHAYLAQMNFRRGLCPGQTVWAAMGGYGWSAAIVTKIGRKYVRVVFPERTRVRSGRRTPDELRPRRAELAGKDKPQPIRRAS